MAEILKNGQVHDDAWQVLRPEAETDPASVSVPTGQWLVPFNVWQAQAVTLTARAETHKDVGVWLSPNDDLAEVAKSFSLWPLVAIDFPKFTDGRGYSIAWRVRHHHKYTGELRAIGNVLVDQLFFMLRVGFDTLALDPSVSAETALKHLTPFPDVYQGSTDNPAPLFRRTDRTQGGAC
jgi:uncharacterized protein (DUF934 family)